MTDDVVVNIELRRIGGPGGDWQGSASYPSEDGPVELAEVAGADSPGTALDELAITLDELETSAIMALERRAEERREDTGR